jgi:hypothetical protein
MKSNDLGEGSQENETHENDAFDLLLNENPADESHELSDSFLETRENVKATSDQIHSDHLALSPPSLNSSFVMLD